MGAPPYYELDVLGNVRRLRAPGGQDLGGYRYTAFGQTLEATVTNQDIVKASYFDLSAQPLRWKGRPYENIGGLELYDMRARVWAPELGSFLSIDEYVFHDPKGTLWSWPNQNPARYSDPSGRCGPCIAIAVAAGTVLGMGVAAPSDTSAAPADIVGMALAVPGAGPAAGRLIRGALEEAASRIPGFGRFLRAPKTPPPSPAAAESCPAPAAAPTITKGSDVTEQVIREAMKDAPLSSQQTRGVSLPKVQKAVDRLLAGETAPAIKVDGSMIVDGNHRYIAGRILGQEPAIQPWAGGRPANAVPWDTLPINPEPW